MLAPGLDADVVARVVSAILAGQWLACASRRALAAETGLSLPEVGRHVEAALATVQGAMSDDVAEMALASVARLERWAEQAARGVTQQEASVLGCFPVAPDLKTAGALTRTANEIAGTIRQSQNVYIDATGQPKGVLADMTSALVSFAARRPDAAAELAECVRAVGGQLRPATETIAHQIAQHVEVVEPPPDWIGEIKDTRARDAWTALWWMLPEDERTGDATRSRLAAMARELVRVTEGT
jgi:hypothetical protein